MFKDKVQINWEFFSDHVLKFFTSTYNDPTLADVTLVSDDNIAVSAHKFILSSSSPVFRKFFMSSPSSAPQCLFMFGLSNTVLRSILEFIYTGETMIRNEELDSFLKGAKNLELSGISIPERQPANNYLDNLDNSLQASQTELDMLLPGSPTPQVNKKRAQAPLGQRGNVAMSAESSPICIDDFQSNNEEGDAVEGDEHEVLNTSHTQKQYSMSTSSQAKAMKGKVRKEPFSCGICDRVFQYRSNLKSHVVLKHGNTVA